MAEPVGRSMVNRLIAGLLWIALGAAACLSGLVWLMSASYVGLIGTALSVVVAAGAAIESKTAAAWVSIAPLLGIAFLGITYVVAAAMQ